jgi:hypothetical protein
MQKQYETPELKLVGKADEVVLGSLIVGSDIRDEYVVAESEFLADQELPGLQG